MGGAAGVQIRRGCGLAAQAPRQTQRRCCYSWSSRHEPSAPPTHTLGQPLTHSEKARAQTEEVLYRNALNFLKTGPPFHYSAF